MVSQWIIGLASDSGVLVHVGVKHGDDSDFDASLSSEACGLTVENNPNI